MSNYMQIVEAPTNHQITTNFICKVSFLQSNFTGKVLASLSNLQDLTLIDLNYNSFEGRIPNFLTNLTKLIVVDLSYNQFSSQIGEFQSCNSLPVLILSKYIQLQFYLILNCKADPPSWCHPIGFTLKFLRPQLPKLQSKHE